MRLALMSALALLLLSGAPLLAQSASGATTGVLVVAHGADETWNARVLDAATAARTPGPLEVSFLMGPAAERRPFQVAARRLVDAGAERIVVVPLLVASHSGHYDQIRWLAGRIDSLSGPMAHHLEMSGITRPDVDVPIAVAPALDDSPALVEALSDRAAGLAAEPSAQAVFLVGHGPNSAEDNARWMENLRRVADGVRQRGGFRDVKVGLVRDDAPAGVRAEAVRRIREIIELQSEATGRDVVVVPILISEGAVNRRKLPADLEGLPVVYDGQPLLPHPAFARWIEEQAAGADRLSASSACGRAPAGCGERGPRG